MQSKVLLVPLLLIAMALSGCTDTDADTDSVPSESGTSVTTMDNKTLEFGPHSGLPTERGENWTASLDEPPQWVLGEWWTIEIEDGFVGNTHTVTRVAAGKEGQDYLVGMPLEDFNDEVMVLHHPGFGLVRKASLGYETHDFLFEPLNFPLQEGESWDSLWQASGNTVTHTVESVDTAAGTAVIQMTGGQAATYTYDANLGAIREFNAPGYMSFQVTDHGFDHEGTVRVPYSHDMTMFHGRLGPAVPVVQSEGVAAQTTGSCLQSPAIVNVCGDVAGPTETFTIPEGYDRASFSIIIFELAVALDGSGTSRPVTDNAGQGVYRVTADAPDGTQYQAQKLPNQGGHIIASYYNDAPAGDWDLEVISAGPAQAFIEGITYNTYDVDLPSGCVEVTENVHDHGGTCGGHVHDIE